MHVALQLQRLPAPVHHTQLMEDDEPDLEDRVVIGTANHMESKRKKPVGSRCRCWLPRSYNSMLLLPTILTCWMSSMLVPWVGMGWCVSALFPCLRFTVFVLLNERAGTTLVIREQCLLPTYHQPYLSFPKLAYCNVSFPHPIKINHLNLSSKTSPKPRQGKGSKRRAGEFPTKNTKTNLCPLT